MTPSKPRRTSSGRPHDPQATRTAILSATIDVISQGGQSAVRVTDVAHRAGVTTGAIYAHFGNRDDLVSAAQVEFLRQRAREFGMAFAGLHEGDLESAATAGASYMRFIEWLLSQAGREARLEWIAAAARAVTDPVLRDRLAPIESGLLDQTTGQIRAMQRNGLVANELDARAVASIRIAVSLGVAVAERPFRDDPTFQDALLHAWPYVTRAFAPRPDTQESDV